MQAALNGILTNEQTLTVSSANGGNFTLTYGANTSAQLPWNATPAAVLSALTAIMTGSGFTPTVKSATATGGPFTITFTGTGTPLTLVATNVNLTGTNPNVSVATGLVVSVGGSASGPYTITLTSTGAAPSSVTATNLAGLQGTNPTIVVTGGPTTSTYYVAFPGILGGLNQGAITSTTSSLAAVIGLADAVTVTGTFVTGGSGVLVNDNADLVLTGNNMTINRYIAVVGNGAGNNGIADTGPLVDAGTNNTLLGTLDLRSTPPALQCGSASKRAIH